MSKRKRDNEATIPFESSEMPLVVRWSILTARRDKIIKKFEENKHSGLLEKDLENILKSISEIEEILKEQKENTLLMARLPADKKMMPWDVKKLAIPGGPPVKIKSALFIPRALWILTAGFLNKTDLARLTQVNTLFVFVYMEYKRELHRKEFPDFDLYNPRFHSYLSCSTRLRLFNDIVREFDSFSTLIDRSYLPLFSALKKYDQETAINFITFKLQSTQDSKENVTDMVFYQKMGNGDTAIILAQKLGLQNFLDFCFEKLILNGHVLNQQKYSLVKTGKLEAILTTTQMQNETLWMYACAYVCNQKNICDAISGVPFWDKTFIEEDEDLAITLSLIAALLSSHGLAVYALDGISEHGLSSQMNYPSYYEAGQIYCNDLKMRASPLGIAIISNHVEMIKYLLPITKSTDDQTGDDWYELSCYRVPLLAFFIKQRNLAELKNCLSDTDGRMLVEPVGIAPKYFGINSSVKLARKYNVLDLVLATRWVQGANLLLAHAAACEDARPLNHVICKGNLRILKFLLAHQLSLFIKYPVLGVDRSEYPLIIALWEETDNDDISSYIIEEIGRKAAIEQILDEIQNPRDVDVGSLIRLREALIEEMRELEETEESPEQLTQTPLSGTNLSILSRGQDNRQNTPEANIPKLG